MKYILKQIVLYCCFFLIISFFILVWYYVLKIAYKSWSLLTCWFTEEEIKIIHTIDAISHDQKLEDLVHQQCSQNKTLIQNQMLQEQKEILQKKLLNRWIEIYF